MAVAVFETCTSVQATLMIFSSPTHWSGTRCLGTTTATTRVVYHALCIGAAALLSLNATVGIRNWVYGLYFEDPTILQMPLTTLAGR